MFDSGFGEKCGKVEGPTIFECARGLHCNLTLGKVCISKQILQPVIDQTQYCSDNLFYKLIHESKYMSALYFINNCFAVVR